MSDRWDEFSKSLAEPLPRRESLRRLGAAFAVAVLSPFGLSTTWAGRNQDPCKAFCRCRNKSQQSQCLAACRDCNSDPRGLCGSCGGYYCPDFANDFDNCGDCGYICDPPGPYEYGACIDGRCEYLCVEGAVSCDGICTDLDWDLDNCGACGNVCGGSTPNCQYGACVDCYPGLTRCGNYCVDLDEDPNNCGACGNACSDNEACIAGVCESGENGCEPWETICDGRCVSLNFDNDNCGACGNVCPDQTACSFGVCQSSGDYYY